jgi:putative ABC transport system permease protein
MPDWKKEIRLRLAHLDLDPAREAAMVDELAAHASDFYDELLRRGITEKDAHHRTLAQLSDARLPLGVMEVEATPRALFSRRFPFAARILIKYWKLTAVALVSLALGMAACVAGLSLFNALLLRPPAAASPSRLVSLYDRAPTGDMQQMSFPDYKFYRDNNQVFSALAAFNYGISIQGVRFGNRTEMLVTTGVTSNYFEVLGVHPAAGRLFSGDDSLDKAEIVLSYPFWERLGRDPAVIGKTVKSGSDSLVIVGVAPKGFAGTVVGFSFDAWARVRMGNNADQFKSRDSRWLTPVGRLKSGVSRERAQADISTLAQQLAHDFPASNKDHTAGLRSLTMLPMDQLGLARMLSWTVMGVVTLVLLAACANVVNLLLGLAAARRQEMLIRAALGASRRKLVGQLLRETAIICVVGGLIGFGLAWYGLERLLAFRPVLFNGLPPLLLDFRPDFRVAGLAVAMMLVVTGAIGLLPALQSSVPNLAGALSGEVAAGGTRKRRARNTLVVVQTAVCTLVLVGAGLCLRSIDYLKRVPLGFSARNLVFTYISGPDDTKPREFYETVRRETAALPGVNAVTRSTSLPLSQNGPPDRVVPEGRESEKEQWLSVYYNLVDDNYFSVLGLPVLPGRIFDSTDGEHSSEVVIINRTLARKFWPDQDVIGKRLRIERGNRLVQIVGVVPDSKYDDLDEPQLPFMYLAIRQHPREAEDLAFTFATGGKPRLWVEPILNRIHKVNPQAYCFMTGTFEDQLNLALLLPRIIFACVSGFGLLALLLSMAGIYATTSYSVGERKKEIGIRLALGAQPRQLMASLLRQSIVITGVGLAVGIGLGVAMSALLGSLLFGIRPVETGVLVGVVTLTATMALVTAYLAARPWVKIDPLEAVRHV